MSRFTDILSGEFLFDMLKKYIWRVVAIYVVLFGGAMLNFRYHGLMREEARMQEEIEHEQRREMDCLFKKTNALRPTQIKQRAEQLGLEMSVDPPKKVNIKDEPKEYK